MVSVEVASWSKYDLPKNAANLLQFMQAELERVPEQYRHAAEFEEFDASYGDELFNSRLFLSYSRLETEEELAHRLEKAKVAGTRVSIKNGLMTVIHDGVVRYKIGKLDQSEPQPFRVEGDQTYISETAIKDATIRSDFTANWLLHTQQGADGRLYIAGLGAGYPSQVLVSADRFAINGRSADTILEALSSVIGTTRLCESLKAEVDKMKLEGLAEQSRADAERPLLAEKVKDVIRTELLPGGLLHRSR